MLSDDQAKLYISENVQSLLLQKGWTQSKLAAICKESEMRVSLMVRGIKIPSAAFLARVAEALEVSVDQLLEDPRKFARAS